MVEYEKEIKTWDTARIYAEKILFPKMNFFQIYQRQANFGDPDLREATFLTTEQRELQKFNGLKGMTDIVYDLLINISSTVRLKKNKEEIKELEKLLKILKKIKDKLILEKDDFFTKDYSDGKIIEKLDFKYFDKIKSIVEKCYINVEILMTKNKLLFRDSSDEFLSDKELLEQIKNEYIEG